MKAALDPVAVPFVAVSAKLPVFVIVIACEASTPLTNVAVVSGAPMSVPVEVMTAELANDVAVLPLASSAVSWMLNGVPAVSDVIAPPPEMATMHREVRHRSASDDESTAWRACCRRARAVRGQVSVKLPAFVMVTACAASTPFVNAAVVSGAPARAPVDVRTAVLANDVAVLPLASSAMS